MFCYAFASVCLFVPCGHLLGKDWPLGSLLWCIIVSLSLSHWYSGSGVVLDCIVSTMLQPYLLSFEYSYGVALFEGSPIRLNKALFWLVEFHCQ